MDAVVVYESMWGNTAAVAHEIAAGLGGGAVALTTDKATPRVIYSCALVVAGAPVHGLSLPSHQTRKSASEKVLGHPGQPGLHADVAHPALRDWFETLPRGPRYAAVFDTHIGGPLGHGAMSGITARFADAGYEMLDEPHGFTVRLRTSSAEPGSLLMPGQEELAREWGQRLAMRLRSHRAAS